MVYHMQFLDFLTLLQKRGLSYVISGISFPTPKMWTIICMLWIFFLFTKNEYYYMQFLEYISLLLKYDLLCAISKHVGYHMKFMEYLSLLQKCGISYTIYGISIPPPKTWSVICNLWKFFPFSKKRGLSYAISEFLSLLKKHGLSNAISEISFTFPNTWTII